MFAALPEQRVLIGVSSGTSADAVDIAFVQASGKLIPSSGLEFASGVKYELIGGGEVVTPPDLKAAITSASSWSVADVAKRHVEIAQFHSQAVLDWCDKLDISTEHCFAVGSHGQTVFHHSGNPQEGTLQLGDLNIMASNLEIPVVGDFRWADIANGGQGAPISAYADFLLHAPVAGQVAVLNLGGIANISLLSPSGVRAWDAGPANGMMDSLVRLHGRGEFDKNGLLAASGRVNTEILEYLQATDYFSREIPKSTGLETFGSQLVENISKKWPDVALNDLLATFMELSCWAIARDLLEQGFKSGRLFLAGGGACNPLFSNTLGGMLGQNIEILNYAETGWSSDLREAVAFALLADAFFFHVPSTWPETTKCAKKGVLGRLAGANYSFLSRVNS